jgi:microcystin-dependent protein
LPGTLFGIGLSQHVDHNGLPLAGARLYIWQSETTTPAIAYADFGLTEAHTWPILANANGRIPAFWVADGSYRALLTDKFGNTVFDEPFIQAIGPSSSEGGGGGGGTVDPNSIFQTGYFLWLPVSGNKSGFVRANARTIGSGSSGATERANTDCLPLYLHLWNNFPDTMCPVLGGRGSSASNDWSANKQIGTLDLRGKAPFGIQSMGNDSSALLQNVTFTVGGVNTPGSQGGTAHHTLTDAQIPAHTHVMQTAGAHRHFSFSNVSLSGAGHQALTANKAPIFEASFGDNQTYNIRQDANNSADATIGRTSEVEAHTHTIDNNTGGGSSHPNMPPFALGTWYVKL